MDDTDIEYLKHCLAAGLIVWWKVDPPDYRRIYRIGEAPKPKDPDGVPEPCEVGYLYPNGSYGFHSGDYAALAAMCREDFIVTTDNLAIWLKDSPQSRDLLVVERVIYCGVGKDGGPVVG